MGLININNNLDNYNNIPNFINYFGYFNTYNFTPNFSFALNSGTGIFELYNTLFSGNKDFTKGANTKVLASLKQVGYSAAKGEKLSKIAQKNTVGFTGNCAKYVKNAISEANLGKYKSGNAYQCAEILENNPNFKEISTQGLNLKDLPAGCILVYDKGQSGYSRKYGHVEITRGDGKADSDGTTKNIRAGARVFVPVSRNYA